MINGGIIRKIDELGRIVIPKEIRTSMNIKENESIEIIPSGNQIVLRKYDKIKNDQEFIKEYIEIMDKLIEAHIIITDREKILISNKIKELENISITNEYSKQLDMRKTIKEKGNINITNNFSINRNYYILPIILNTDLIGSIVLIKEEMVNNEDMALINMLNYLIKKRHNM